ncbi:hypothetical protein TBR22_A27910 [Luteitalea sp. TBR-22]|uniref:hybrid sensor histidine kinase/response regulator n=1 Tax=Luteitalea sp. TBR-22 TaxID=2802971 RepID=UPI001AFA7BB3|nr:ATP-binding protein [Luteitalea sp. TBR-22]BCS33564.1 hypothetical protein TBR22_A27910 [Luteitalea sp. TBR-22]
MPDLPLSAHRVSPDALRAIADGEFGAWHWDADADLLQLEPRWAHAFGLGAGRLQRRTWFAAVTPAECEEMRRAWQRALRGDRPVEWRVTLAGHGPPRHVLVRARRTGGPARGLEGVLLVVTAGAAATDDTPRPDASHPVDAAFRAVVDAVPALVWAAHPDGRVAYFNAALQQVVGTLGPEEWERALHPQDLQRIRVRWLGAVRREAPYEARCRVHRAADDTWRWHALRAVPVRDPEGHVERWVGILVDDHDQRRLMEANQHLLASEQRARQAAEDAARMKDEFLATLAHELRTPLNAITGWTGLLKRGGLSEADQARALDVIERNAQAQRQLIDQLLDVSRVIAGHVRLDQESVALDDVLLQALQAVRPLADARGLRLDVQIADRAPLVWGDSTRLRQACDQLLANAVKFTPAGGAITARLHHDAHRVTIEVTDTGIGIPADFLPFVFDRFRQSESPAARRYGGLGLGLAIARQVVEMHGGEIAVTSPGEGLGATFTVSLPATGVAAAEGATPAESPAPQDGAPSPLRGQSILVIEDDADSREMLSVVLENAGGVPVGAATVADGLRLLGDLQIDIVLSDIGLPGRDGFDLIRALRSFPHPRVRRAPAIAVTAFTRAEDRARVLDAGFDAHVGKPVEPARLLAAIAEVTRRREDAAGAAPPA